MLVVIVTPAIAQDYEKIEKLAKECQAGKKASCRKLGDIAKNDEDYSVRMEAVKKNTDQSLLENIVRESKDWHIREAAVKKLTDQTILTNFAIIEDHIDRIVCHFKLTFDTERLPPPVS